MDVWESLVPGGTMIYSTCTFNTSENEENVAWFQQELGAEVLPITLPQAIIAGRHGIGNYCLPGKTETEGFYIAVLQKGEDDQIRQRFTRKSEFRRQKDLLDIETYADLSGISVINWNERLLALPSGLEDRMLHVQAQMRLQKMGTTIGEVSRKGIIPNEELALDPSLLKYGRRINVERQQALEFLHGDTFSLAGQHGYQLITFENEPLGWIKHLGNRFNNLYPKEWRIRMNVK